ncbi:hypothetical protein [Alteromonas antoniana]|uniref:hypothetical protein n=1 Tax=Alteromonas antoniana TaxID=2803813 RepID=UPI001C46B7A2|nr:hypothetical protein [Alteromonas antoniana]
MKLTTALLISLFTVAAAPALASDADKLNDAFNQLCDKMEVCALEQMGKEENLTPQMRSMIEGMIDGMCKNMMNLEEIDQYSELVDPAVACIDSMTSQSCAELEGDEAQTPACQEYERQAEAFRAELDGE